jgi:hypothetical protein
MSSAGSYLKHFLLKNFMFHIHALRNIYTYVVNRGACGGMVEALRYKPAGRGSIPDGVGIFH